MVEFVAAEGMHGAGKLREALHVAALLEEGAVHARRKTHGFRAVGAADPVDESLEGDDHILEPAAAAVEPVNTGIDQQAGIEEPVEKRRLHVHFCSPQEAGVLLVDEQEI